MNKLVEYLVTSLISGYAFLTCIIPPLCMIAKAMMSTTMDHDHEQLLMPYVLDAYMRRPKAGLNAIIEEPKCYQWAFRWKQCNALLQAQAHMADAREYRGGFTRYLYEDCSPGRVMHRAFDIDKGWVPLVLMVITQCASKLSLVAGNCDHGPKL